MIVSCSLIVIYAKITPIMSELTLGTAYFLSLTIILLPLLIPLVRKYLEVDTRREITASDDHREGSSSIRLWCIVIIPALLISIFPKLFLRPSGDDVAYIKAIIETQELGPNFLLWGDNTVVMRPLLYMYFTVLSYLCANNYIVVFTLSKIFASVIFVFGVYRLLSHFKISEETRLWASSISSVLPSILLLNTDLYANFFAYAISFVFFSALLDYLQNPNRKSLMISSLGLIIIAFIHIETYLLVVLATFIFILVSKISPTSRNGVMYPTLKIILPSMITLLPFALLSITNLHYFGVLSNYLGPVKQRYGLTFFNEILSGKSYVADPMWGNRAATFLLIQGTGSISTIINFLALILILLGAGLTGLDTNARKLLFSMNCIMIVYTLNLFGVGNIVPGRWVLFYPAPLLIGLGLNWAGRRINSRISLKILEKRFKITKYSNKKLKTILCASILLYSVCVAVNIRMTHGRRVYAPSVSALDETTQLREMFGYGNESIIILVKPEQNWGRLTEWTEAITGDKVYLGHISYLLNNQTLEDAHTTLEKPIYDNQGLIGSWNRLRINGALGHLQNYTFVISEGLYTPDANELKMLVKISDRLFILNKTYFKFT